MPWKISTDKMVQYCLPIFQSEKDRKKTKKKKKTPIDHRFSMAKTPRFPWDSMTGFQSWRLATRWRLSSPTCPTDLREWFLCHWSLRKEQNHGKTGGFRGFLRNHRGLQGSFSWGFRMCLPSNQVFPAIQCRSKLGYHPMP